MLPRLRTFQLTGTVQEITDFLDLVSLPHSIETVVLTVLKPAYIHQLKSAIDHLGERIRSNFT